MSNLMLKGLGWGHRRAAGPLEPLSQAFRGQCPDVTVDWTIRPLSDFEHQPIGDIVGEYDFLIIDHPFCGDIAAASAFLPLEEAIPDLLGPQADGFYVGDSLPSYRYRGHVWAAPIDAATPHAAYRPDLLDRCGERVPKSWRETIALGKRIRDKGFWLATPVKSPHAFATVASLMANLGRPIATDPDEPFTFDRETMSTALDALDELLALSPPETLEWNAIAIEEAMVDRNDIVFTPSVYGYATYAEADMRAPLRFADFCGLRAPYEAGSMLGGTGLAVSAATQHRDIALNFVRFCLSRDAQDRIIPEHHGQPALVTAWEDAANDARFGGYYSSIRRSIETAWTRPRRPSYIRFQAKAGDLIEACCRRDIGKSATLDRIAAAAEEIFGEDRVLTAAEATGG
ncbi:MAG: extracellular solute-binding protein [Bauldia sp.]|uniref:ABC transporter substrate-binding protein n=1 Tax=Bauldia sp. TaxID=2575872 RepID=UPI001D2D9C19|nr:extracellular solute-binding protein [Bauldia sp.]MCB1494761.1 extracellular solute-binding protein [Bauldia sp.]